MLWPLAVTPGVTHVGAYHRPSDGHFFLISIFSSGTVCNEDTMRTMGTITVMTVMTMTLREHPEKSDPRDL